MRMTLSKNVNRTALAGALLATVALGVTARAELVDRIAAVVNDQVIALSEVERRAAPELARIGQIPDPNKRGEARRELIRQALDGLIGEKLMEAEMKELGIEVSEQEAKAGVEEMRTQNQLTPEQWAEALRREGYTLKQYEALIRDALGKRKLINLKVRPKVKIADADLQSAYKQHVKLESADVEVSARHILVQLPPGAPAEQVAAAKEKAQALAAEARQPGVDFAELARAKSEGPSASSGGDLGTFGRGMMLPEFERVAFNLPEGGVSEPVRTQHGFHVIKVEARKAVAPPAFEEVKNQLREKMTQEQLEKYTQQYVDELRQKATVEVKLQG